MELIQVEREGHVFEGFEQDGIEYAITSIGVVSEWYDKYLKKFYTGQELTAPPEDEVEWAYDWLAWHSRPRKTFNRQIGSYGLKHLAEKKRGYISNGALILAALRRGLQVDAREDSPNVDINISVLDD